MIPREILKKIKQIEIRTNRLVSESLAGQYHSVFKGIFRAFVKHRDAVKMVTFWGVNDAVSWRSNGKPLLFDGNEQPKPAFDAVIRAASRGQSKSTQ